MIGRTVGHYRILERLGGGGMGVVYKAEDTKLGRMVALKFLPPELTRDPDAKSRFLREARSASLLDHTNICTIYDIGETDDEQTFIAMACYDGETLKARIERGALATVEALDMAAQIARGLSKAHGSGIVHRDIKPANVIVTTDGVAKILDFGLAKLTGATHITQSKTTLGTLAYMAPEQLRGETVGPQADLWALGIVLFELLTGQRPFRGDYEQAIAYSILNEQPLSLVELRPEAPAELDRILKLLLRKDPLQRYQSSDEVQAELERLRVPSSGPGSGGPRDVRPRESLPAGARLGPYEIVERLGSGGMGDVYRARDTRLDRQVAIKVLARAVSEDVALRERFRREAKTISSLSHPNICVLFDVGEQEGTDFLVMEHLAGETLADRLARGALPLPELLEIAIQIGDALAAAHRQGVVHRDLKPANVMLTASGGVKLLDFGLAKGIASVLEAIDSGEGVDSPRLDARREGGSDEAPATVATSPSPETPGRPLTAEGAIVGTLPYMSPEQVEGCEADARSDIFALGAILYEMATGRRAFRGDTKARLLAAILEREPKALAESGAPSASALQAVVSRCLEKDPEKRFAAATDLTAQLRRLAASGELELSAVGRLTRRPVRWMAAHAAAVSGIVLLLVVTGAVVGTLEWRREHADAAEGTATATPASEAVARRLEPRRVVVAVFENRTGDGSLDRVGQMAADWIIDALVPTGTDVVPAAVSVEPVAPPGGRALIGPDADQAVVLAEAAKAGLLVTGETYLSGDSIRLHAKVIDVATRKQLYAIEHAEAPRANPDGAVEAVSARARDAVTHAVRIRETDPMVRWNDRSVLSELRPPCYEAVVELRLARDARNRQNTREQCAHSARAVELDPGFVTALASLMDCHFVRGEFPEAEASREKVWALRSRLTPAGRLHLEGYVAMMEGRHERAVVVQREAVKLEPGEPAIGHQLARYLIHANRPVEAISVLDSADWGFMMRPEAQQWGVLHYVMLTSSLSGIGKHERELTEARKARGTFGSLVACALMEARALASLGRIAELIALIEASLSEGGSDIIMLHAGNRLNAAGYPGEAATMWNRAVSWIQNRPPDEARARRGTLANALINAGRLDEAERVVREEKRLLEAPATERPIGSEGARIRAEAQLGVIAAMRGDRAAAIAISERIGKLNGPYLFGATHYERARIAGRLGDREESVRLLSAAIADGFFVFNTPRGVAFRDEPSFDSLRGYEPFEELIRPKE